MDFRTLNELFERRVEASASRRAMQYHRDARWVDVTWADMAREVDELANGLLSLGLQKGDAVAILGETRPEWCTSDLAVLAAGGRSVGIYQTNTAKQCEHILSDSAARFLFVDSEAQLRKIHEVKGGCPALERAILWQGVPPQNGGFTLSFDQLRALGRDFARAHPEALGARRTS